MPSYYTKRSEDELQKQAQQQYQSYYDQLRTAARQKQEREALALEGQRSGIQRTYQKQVEDSERNYRQAYSQASNETLRRGMQRSSYAAQRLANVNQEGLRATQNIMDQQASAEGNLDAQIAQLSGQLADTLAGYDANQAADVMKRYNELQDEEYNRAREAEQYAESIRQWQAQHDESIRQFNTQFEESVRQFNLLHPQDEGGGGGGGSWSGGSGGSGSRGTNKPAQNSGATDEKLKAIMGNLGVVNGNNILAKAVASKDVRGTTVAKTPTPSKTIGGVNLSFNIKGTAAKPVTKPKDEKK